MEMILDGTYKVFEMDLQRNDTHPTHCFIIYHIFQAESSTWRRTAADKAGNIDFYSTEIDPDYFADQEKTFQAIQITTNFEILTTKPMTNKEAANRLTEMLKSRQPWQISKLPWPPMPVTTYQHQTG